MTTELEKEFFDTFGIAPKFPKACILKNINCIYCKECEYKYGNKDYCIGKKYPKITDGHYLELLCIVPDIEEISLLDKETLKTSILRSHISDYKWSSKAIFEDTRKRAQETKDNVQQLFKE